MEKYQSNLPSIEEFNSWSLEDKDSFIGRNLSQTSPRKEVICGIPRFITIPENTIVKYFYEQ